MPSRQRSIQVEAIVLSHKNFGEADRILRLFTRELGKVTGIAKGVRKLHSRKAGHLEPFSRTKLQLAKGRDLYIITQAEIEDAYSELREDLMSIGLASYTVELLDKFTYEEGENRAIYHLLTHTLKNLTHFPNPHIVVRFFEIRFLDLLGFRPQLFSCALCAAEIKAEDQYFSSSEGGVLCPKCGKGTSTARPISMQCLKYLRHFQRSNFNKAARANPTAQINREMEVTMHHYLTYLLERELNTPSFLRELDS